MNDRKGIILAGGSGTRLYPLTMGLSKQLLPIYDKPMIYYPLTVLMLAKIREILIITTPRDLSIYQNFLGDGSQWGLSLSYKIQPNPDGLAQAFVLAENFLSGSPSAMILGDNIFFGHGLSQRLQGISKKVQGATIFGYHVSDPQRYGVVDFKNDWSVRSIVEKPTNSPSNFAVTGLYFVDGTAPIRAKEITPSSRGELEITSLLESYLTDGVLTVERFGRGYAWLDTGTHTSLLEASSFVKTIIERQGLQIGSPDEVAFINNWISKDDLMSRASFFGKNAYGDYLSKLASTV